MAVRLRPRNADECVADADFADCVELQPELKRLKLRKNNWDTETYEFDEVLTESASQKRVYQVVAKPVVESVLEGYNGTVMAYGQTGTGKTFTLGRLGDEDTAARGIMVRSMEDIISGTSLDTDSISVSYLQVICFLPSSLCFCFFFFFISLLFLLFSSFTWRPSKISLTLATTILRLWRTPKLEMCPCQVPPMLRSGTSKISSTSFILGKHTELLPTLN